METSQLDECEVPAGVDVTLSDAPAEEAFASITAGGAIMFTCGFITTDCTVGAHAIFCLTDVWLCRHVFCEKQHGQSRLGSSHIMLLPPEHLGLSCNNSSVK